MEKIINGKLYSTDTATLVDSNSNNLSRSDFKYLREDLYKKKTGEFFIHGQGGALTVYAEQYADGKGEGEKIIPMSEDEAKKWMEKNSTVEKYVETFGEVEE